MIPCRECGKDSGWTQELLDSDLFQGNVNCAVCDDWSLHKRERSLAHPRQAMKRSTEQLALTH